MQRTYYFFKSLACGATLALAACSAWSDPGYYLVSVYEEARAARVDYRYWTVQNNGRPTVVWPEIGFGYSVNTRWYTELFMSYIGPSQSQAQPSTLNWQNDILLTQGQYPWDVALHTQLIAGQSGSDDNALEIGPVLQTDFGRLQVNTNLLLEQQLASGNGKPAQLKYQWQAKYRWNGTVHTGLQGFGELGNWNQWSAAQRQSHRWGPVLAVSFAIDKTQRVEYQIAYLIGSVYGAAGDMLSMRLQYVY